MRQRLFRGSLRGVGAGAEPRAGEQEGEERHQHLLPHGHGHGIEQTGEHRPPPSAGEERPRGDAGEGDGGRQHPVVLRDDAGEEDLPRPEREQQPGEQADAERDHPAPERERQQRDEPAEDRRRQPGDVVGGAGEEAQHERQGERQAGAEIDPAPGRDGPGDVPYQAGEADQGLEVGDRPDGEDRHEGEPEAEAEEQQQREGEGFSTAKGLEESAGIQGKNPLKRGGSVAQRLL